jgi:NADPH-dependent 7-cyano-7-deazaguanine reductase QueF-like protein
MILFAFNQEKYAKIGAVKMVFAPEESAIATQAIQGKIVPSQAVLQINSTIH